MKVFIKFIQLKLFLTRKDTLFNESFSKFKIFFKILFWKIYFLIFNTKIIKWFNDTYLKIYKNNSSSKACLYFGLPDYEEMEFLKRLVKKNDIFLDIGANVGVYSLFVTSISRCLTYSFEPDNYSRKILFENIKINKLSSKIKVQKQLIGKSNSIVYFSNLRNSTENKILKIQTSNKIISKKSMQLDYYIKKFRRKNLIIKIDAEGEEFDILRSSKLIYEENILALIFEVSNSKIKRFIRQKFLNNFSLVRLNINQKIFKSTRKIEPTSGGNIMLINKYNHNNKRLLIGKKILLNQPFEYYI